ncbi:MAG: glycosyltransferase family 4 protein [Alphaproteobacteria bacterium]|nr:glycosyltransferase family 4 protein [Alphaproteobacteria bacterium SS10]
MRLVIITPYCDGTDVGESRSACDWVRHLAMRYDVTVLTMQRAGRTPLEEQIKDLKVVSWPEPSWLRVHERLNAMMKPAYAFFYRKARRWLADNLDNFDLVHQIGPLAMRYPCPATGLGKPYILGPLAGSLTTPPGFTQDGPIDAWYARLRAVDHLRLKHDPWLRRSYREAAHIMGAGTYVQEALDDIGIKSFSVESEIGIPNLAPLTPRRREPKTLLHIGRGVRTKGLRDAIRCLARLHERFPDLTLISAGKGPEIDRCKAEAERLGVSAKIQFLGQVAKAETEALYQDADIFLFPSFREPSGNVVFEAMRHGLPVVTTDRGGPGHVVDNRSGIKVKAIDPEQLAGDLAREVSQLLLDPKRYAALVDGARDRVATLGYWRNKLDRVDQFYQAALADDRAKPAAKTEDTDRISSSEHAA